VNSFLNRAATLRVGFSALLVLLLVGILSTPTGASAHTTDVQDGQWFSPSLAQTGLTASLGSQPGKGYGQLQPIGGAPTAARTAASPIRAIPLPTNTPSFLIGPPVSFETSTPTDTATPGPTRTPTQTPTATVVPHTPAPMPTVQADLSPVVPPEPECTLAVVFTITPSQDQYRITEQATMPSELTALPEVTGLCDISIDDLLFVWDIEIDYVPRDLDPEYAPAYHMHYRWPGQTSEGAQAFPPDFGDVVRGGTLTLRATMWVDHVPYSAKTTVTILGSNPSIAALQSYFASNFPISYYTLWRIAQAESNLRHFSDDGHPKWSNDSHHGVGLMQITYPVPSDDEIWSWKHNADAGSRVLQAAYATARNWPATVARSHELRSALDAYNAARERDGQPRLSRVTVPEFTSGNLLCNLLQRENNAIRLYNGAAGTDNLGLPLHEYKLSVDPTEGLLDLVVDEDSQTATAQWVRVPASERLRGAGVPDYVSKVLERPVPGACR
jgi:hypothetical protein